jgi:hypothetical protein
VRFNFHTKDGSGLYEDIEVGGVTRGLMRLRHRPISITLEGHELYELARQPDIKKYLIQLATTLSFKGEKNV